MIIDISHLFFSGQDGNIEVKNLQIDKNLAQKQQKEEKQEERIKKKERLRNLIVKKIKQELNLQKEHQVKIQLQLLSVHLQSQKRVDQLRRMVKR